MKKKVQSIPNIIEEYLTSSTLPDEKTIRQLVESEPELATLLILEQAKKLRELQTPKMSTPSGMVPVYEKPTAKPRKKKPGQKQGHKGNRRPTPTKIDQRVEHRLTYCPDCHTQLKPGTSPKSKRTRLTEDIQETIQPIVTEHTIHRDYCPNCKKLVEPKVPDALPGANIGNRLLSLSSHWHYGVGLTISQIGELLNSHLNLQVSGGGLVNMWQRLAQILTPWYEELADHVQKSAVLHADETGWRVNGKTHWLWCFTQNDTTVYMIDKSRGSPALKKFFKEAFEGILITDFWAAYDAITKGLRQFCLAHLLRELEKVDKTNSSTEWCAFSKKTRRLFKDALRLRYRDDYSPETYASRIERLQGRLIDLMLIQSDDADVTRLAKRLEKYWDELLVFLDHLDVPPTNNHGEHEIRPAVIMRKVMQGNRSEKGAQTQAILMTIFRTLRRRGLKPVETIESALRHVISTKSLPTFPSLG